MNIQFNCSSTYSNRNGSLNKICFGITVWGRIGRWFLWRCDTRSPHRITMFYCWSKSNCCFETNICSFPILTVFIYFEQFFLIGSYIHTLKWSVLPRTCFFFKKREGFWYITNTAFLTIYLFSDILFVFGNCVLKHETNVLGL